MECYKKFYDNSLYKNDKRYVEAIVKCVSVITLLYNSTIKFN